VGAAYGLVWSPCVGPTLGCIILAAGSPDTADQGIPLLVIHGLGFGLPLLFSGYILDGFLRRIKQPWIPLVLEKTAGISLVVAGLLIATCRFLILMDGLFQTFDSWVHVLIQGGL